MSSFRLIFSDIVSHGPGMQQFGTPVSYGFSNEEMLQMLSMLPKDQTEMHNLKNFLPNTLYNISDTFVLIIKNFFNDDSNNILSVLSSSEASDNEFITGVNWDKERIHNGKLVNNKLCNKLVFYDLNNDFKLPLSLFQNIGTIYNYRKIPSLHKVQQIISSSMGTGLFVEAENFYNLNECYVPMNQEKNKRKNVGLILGNDFPLHFCWYHNQQKCSDIYTINLRHGDLYILSDNAAGFNKESKTKLYLKHGFGYNQNLI